MLPNLMKGRTTGGVNRVKRVNRVNRVNHVKRVNGVNRVNRVNRVKKVKRVNLVNKVKYVNRVNAVKRVKSVKGVKGGKTRSPQRNAGSAAIRPKPHALSKSSGPSLTAVLVRHSRIRALVNPGWRLHISETKPVTNGVAIDVPLNSS